MGTYTVVCLEGPRTREGWKGWLMAETNGRIWISKESVRVGEEMDDGCDEEGKMDGGDGEP